MVRFMVLLALMVTLGCHDERTGGSAFRLMSFAQGGRQDLRLNERLEFYFNAELYPGSVTSDSFRLQSDTGVAPRGRLRVDGTRITFEPDLASRPDLQDGGLLPATTYEVEVAGGLQIKSLQTRQGRRLAMTYQFSFRTVGVEQPDAFIDDRPGVPPTGFVTRPDFGARPEGVLVLQSQTGGLVREHSPFIIWFDQHLDPRTVVKESFQVKRILGGEPVELDSPLLNVELKQEEVGCLLFLFPETPVQVDDYYVIVPALVKDLGGTAVSDINRWIEFRGLSGG